MVQANQIALGRVVTHTRERLVAIEPRDAGLLATTLRSRDEVMNVAEALEGVPKGNAYARNAGLRIDHFLLSQDLAKRLKRAQVDTDVRGWEKTSDHAPVWIELKNVRGRK